MKKIAAFSLLTILALSGFKAYSASGDTRLMFDSGGVDTVYTVPTRNFNDKALLGGDDVAYTAMWYYFGNGFNITHTSGIKGSDNYQIGLDLGGFNPLDIGNLGDLLDAKASIAQLGVATSSLASATASLNAMQALLNANIYGTSTSMTIASSTATHVLIDRADAIKLASLSTSTTPKAFATSSRSIVTGTGATGYQVSSTRDTLASYAVNIVTTASIGGNQDGYVTLEIAPTNSATSTDWYEIGSRCRNGQALTLAITLQSVQTAGCNVSGVIPAGYYARLRSVNVSGTPTFSFISGQEVKF